MEYSYKFRLYPDAVQSERIKCNIGCCRFVYNHFLALRKKLYQKDGKSLNYTECANMLPNMKKELPWLAEADSTSLQASLRHLDSAYENFFRRVKQGIKPYGYPKFRSKHKFPQSYQSKCNKTLSG